MATALTSYEELLKENDELKAQLERTQQNQTQYQTPAEGSQTTPKNYISPYAQELESLAGELKNSNFDYKKEEDPSWQAMRKEYLMQADRTRDDVLAKASVNTGGRANSYAVTAAGQAANELRASLSQAEQTLFDRAYDRYYTEYSRKLQELQNLQAWDQENYNRVMAEETLALERQDAAYDDLVRLIMYTGHSPSAEELSAANMSAAEAKSWAKYYADQKALASSAGGGYSYGGASDSNSDVSIGSGGSGSSGGTLIPVSASDKYIEDLGDAVANAAAKPSTGVYGSTLTSTSKMDTSLKGVDTDYMSLSSTAKTVYNNLKKNSSLTSDHIKTFLSAQVSTGSITASDKKTILKLFNIS